MLGVIGVLCAIALLIFMAYKGWGVIPASIICSAVVAVTNGVDLNQAFTVHYMNGVKYFVGAFLLIFLLGSLFGKVMSDSGAASSLSYKLVDIFGASQAILVVTLATALLSYGGVNVFIVIFTVYPIALIVFKEADLPKRIIVACVALGAATFTMTALPGTSSVQNLVPAQVLGTPTTAAPLLGIVGTLVMMVLGYLYLTYEAKKARERGEGFVPGAKDGMWMQNTDPSGLPGWVVSLVPIVVVLGLIFGLKGRVESVTSVVIALVGGILVTYAIFWKRIKNPLQTLNEGSLNSISPLVATAVIVGFGYVVQNVPAFQSFVKFALGMQFHPLVSVGFAVNIIAGITGSSSGGLTIFMKTMGPEYVKMGVNPEVLHRIAAIASGGLDSLPHSGTVITVLAIMGMTHKEGYKGIGVTTVIIPIIALICVTLLAIAIY